jgi:Uma2 family endonuclease
MATEEELLQSPADGRKRELVDGQIRVSPAGYRHGRICMKLGALLQTFAAQRQLGDVLDSSTGFRLPGGNVRLPDVAFVARGRLGGGPEPEGFCDIPPDLAVEVLSPDDRSRDVLDKVGEYLQAGLRLVWVIDPRGRTAAIYRSMTDVRRIGAGDSLDGEYVLPGFRCLLAEVID